MSATVHDALRWNLGEVSTQSTCLEHDATEFDSVAGDLRADADRTFDGFSGETVMAATDVIEQVTKSVFAFSDDLDSASRVLSTFAAEVIVYQTRLRSLVARADDMKCDVLDDGRVTGPPGMSSSDFNEMQDLADDIDATIRAIRLCDRKAASDLAALYEAESPQPPTAPNYSDNGGWKTTIAGLIATEPTSWTAKGLAAAAAASGDDALAVVRGTAVGLPVLGQLIALTAGIGGAPEGEPMTETLVAEIGGLMMGAGVAAGGAGLGALAGSATVPVVGTGAGGVLGFAGGLGAGLQGPKMIRDRYDDQRAERVEDWNRGGTGE